MNYYFISFLTLLVIIYLLKLKKNIENFCIGLYNKCKFQNPNKPLEKRLTVGTFTGNVGDFREPSTKFFCR